MMGSSWREFWNQDDLFKALETLPDDSEARPFAFQLSADGARMYVLAKPELVGGVVLGFKMLPGGGGVFRFAEHCFEHFGFHDLPMILYADCEYSVPLNPTRDAAAMVEILIRYVRRVCAELFEANEVPNTERRAERLRINVETSHRSDKMSVHLKIPQVIVEDMAAQHAFWSRLQALLQEEQLQGVEDALQMLVMAKNGTETIQGSFVDMSVYVKQQGQLFRTLGAAKNEKELHFLVPEGRRRSSITLEEWLASLVLRPHAKKGVLVPKEWYPKEDDRRRASSSSSSSAASSSSCRSEAPTRTSTIPQEVGAQLFAFIDPQWKVSPENVRITSYPPETKTVVAQGFLSLPIEKITTQTFVVAQTGRSFYCPLKKSDHDSNAAYLIVRVKKSHERSYTHCFCKVACQSHHAGSVSYNLSESPIGSAFVEAAPF